VQNNYISSNFCVCYFAALIHRGRWQPLHLPLPLPENIMMSAPFCLYKKPNFLAEKFMHYQGNAQLGKYIFTKRLLNHTGLALARLVLKQGKDNPTCTLFQFSTYHTRSFNLHIPKSSRWSLPILYCYLSLLLSGLLWLDP
jgi:hypothetical protein